MSVIDTSTHQCAIWEWLSSQVSVMLYCLCMKPAWVSSHHNLHAAKNGCGRSCQLHLSIACCLSKQFRQIVPLELVKFNVTWLLQILVEKSLIETVGLEWAGAEGPAGSSPAPAAASSNIATRNFALLTQRMESDLAASRSTYSFSSTLQTGSAMAQVYMSTHIPALLVEMYVAALHNQCYRSPAHGLDMQCL